MTGLYNRRFLYDSGRKFIASGGRGDFNAVVAMIDIEHFKGVNDTYGHDGGDAVLTRLAKLFKDQSEEGDIVARVGREEFCVLAVNMGQGDAVSVFDTLRQRVADLTIGFEDREIRLTISIGLCTERRETLDDMITAADHRLISAKAAGRNQVMAA